MNCDPKDLEYLERQKQALRKISNNSILNEETKEAIRFAVFRIDDVIWLQKQYNELHEQYERVMKERNKQ